MMIFGVVSKKKSLIYTVYMHNVITVDVNFEVYCDVLV